MAFPAILGTVVLAGVNPSGEPKFIDGTYLVAALDADGEPHILEVDASGDLVVSGGSSLYDAYVLIQDRKAQGTDGGNFASGADRVRDLNTEVVDDHDLASVAANQITLAAGTYDCLIHCPAYAVIRHRAWLYNVTGSAILVLGIPALSPTTNADMVLSVIQGRFTLAVQSVLEVRHRCESTQAVGFGVASNFAGVEIYTSVEFRRVAA